MNQEKLNNPEQGSDGREPITIPIDSLLFDRLDELQNRIGDEKIRASFGATVEEGKLLAFKYASEMLDYLGPNPVPRKKKDEEEDAHHFNNFLSTANLSASAFCGVQLDIPHEGHLSQSTLGRMEAATLQYVFSKLNAFQKRAKEGKEDLEKIAEEIKFPRTLDPEKLSVEFSAKLDKLDHAVREGLWAETR